MRTAFPSLHLRVLLNAVSIANSCWLKFAFGVMLAHLDEDLITGCFDESHLHLLIGWKPFVFPGLNLLYLGAAICIGVYLLVSP